MSRKTPEGSVLEWSLAVPARGAKSLPGGGLLPFLIDWEDVLQDGLHPAKTSPAGCTLLELRLAHPEPARIAASLSKLGMQLDVAHGDAPMLAAVLATPKAPAGVILQEAFFDGGDHSRL